MRNKDTILLENAYEQISQKTNFPLPRDPAERLKYLDDLIAGFNMNPKRGSALAAINEAYLGKVVTLYKHKLGASEDTYEGGKPVRVQSLDSDDENAITGKVEKIFYGPDSTDLQFVVAGETYNITQGRWWVKPTDLGGSSLGAPTPKSTGGEGLRPPGMRF